MPKPFSFRTLTHLWYTTRLRLYTLWRVPMVAFVRPVVETLERERCVIRIPLSRRTRNHQGVMYFGVLCVGADLAGGIFLLKQIQDRGLRVSFLFRDFKAEFIRRAEGDVRFTCVDGPRMLELLERAMTTGERVEGPVDIVATVPSQLGDDPVARFKLMLTLKSIPTK